MKKFKLTKNDRPTDKQLDALWSEACLWRDGHRCVYSFEVLHRQVTGPVLQVHHILKKATNRLRWDLDSGITAEKGVHFGLFHSEKPIVESQMRQWALGRLTKKAQDKLNMYQHAVGGVDRFALKIYLLQKIREFSNGQSEFLKQKGV